MADVMASSSSVGDDDVVGQSEFRTSNAKVLPENVVRRLRLSFVQHERKRNYWVIGLEFRLSEEDDRQIEVTGRKRRVV